jgi:hypothetical protein
VTTNIVERRLLAQKRAAGEALSDNDLALLVRVEIEDSLARGTRHTDAAGNPLATVKEILDALHRDGHIIFLPAE